LVYKKKLEKQELWVSKLNFIEILESQEKAKIEWRTNFLSLIFFGNSKTILNSKDIFLNMKHFIHSILTFWKSGCFFNKDAIQSDFAFLFIYYLRIF
jgi:hypothetical protein